MTKTVGVYLSYIDMKDKNYAEAKLGTLTIDHALALQDMILNASPSDIKCPNYINAGFAYSVEIARAVKMPTIPEIRYTVNATFKPKDETPKCGQKHMSRSGPQMTKMCAKNLRSGKCQCPFMRRTLGTALFPNLYATDKQK